MAAPSTEMAGPDDEEPGLRIGELARRTGLSVRALHHYDQIGLLQPSWRTWGDHRLYSRDDLRRLLAIQHLKSLGLGLQEIADALDRPGFDARASLAGHIEAVRSRLADERRLLQQLESLQGAAEVGWDEVLEVVALSERLRHPDPSVRVRAALHTGHTSVESLVRQLADEPDPSVRETLTWAVAQHGSQATPAVLARLDDPRWQVRLQMAQVLGKLGDARAVGPLLGLLDDEHPLVAAKAAFAVGQLLAGSPRDGAEPGAGVGLGEAAAALVAHLGLGDEVFRDTLTEALALAGPAAVPALLPRLDDPSPVVRAQAADVLAQVGSDAQADALAALLRDDDETVRVSALLALGAIAGRAQRPNSDEGTDTTRAQAALAEAAHLDDRRLRVLAVRLLADQAGA